METSLKEEPPSSPKLIDHGSVKKSGSFFIQSKTSSLKNLEIQIVSDISQCFKLWQEFSPQKTLFDTWEFRFAFNNAYQFKPYFILIKNLSENLALLPLEYDANKKSYVWFGSPWQEENKFFAKNSDLIPLLLSVAPKPISLNAIDFFNVNSLNQSIDFKIDSPKYVLNLENIKTTEDFLMNLSKNNRHALKKDKRRIEKQNPKIIIKNSPDFADLNNLIKLNKERFEQKKEEVDWEDPKRIEAFRQIIQLNNQSYKLKSITVLIGEKIAGIDLIATFNNCYYALKCGYDVKNFSGIGNFVNLFEINDAINLGMKKIDFLQNNYTWKSRWFESFPLLEYVKNA